MAARKTRDSDCCSVNFLKYVLHIFNVVFLLSGIAVLLVGLWTVLYKHQYINLMSTDGYAVVAYVLVAAGALAVIGAIMGCCGVWRENRCMILLYTFLLLLIFLLEATAGILSYAYVGQVGADLNMTLNDTFLQNYEIDVARTTSINAMQQEYKCCGAVRFEDWKYSQWKIVSPLEKRLVPDSCCKTITPICGLRDHPSNIYYNGCIYKATSNLEHQLTILGAVGLGVCTIQIFGMILNCCLYVKLKDIFDD